MKTEMTARASRPARRAMASPRLLRLGVGLALLASLAASQAAVDVTTRAGGPITPGGSSFGFVDGPSLEESQFHTPSGLAVDSASNLYVADRDNGRIRKLDITANRSSTILSDLDRPVDVALDSANNLYVLIQGSGTIRKYDGFGNLISIAASGLVDPTAMALDSSTNIYVTEFGGSVKRINSAGVVTTVLSGFNQPEGIEVLDTGLIAVSDTGNHAIKLINPIDRSVRLLAGGLGADFADGTAAQAKFNQPFQLAKAPNGTLVVADRANNRVRLVATNGATTTLYGINPTKWVSDFPGWEDGDQVTAEAREPVGVAVAANGKVYTTEVYYHIIREITGAELTASGSTGGPTGTNIVVTPPTISPNSGYFPMGQTIVVNSPNPTVFYTTDGSEPTTNSLRVDIVGNVGAILWKEPLRDLSSLRVKAFVGTNASVTVNGQTATVNQVGIPRDVFAGVGSTVVIPVVANLIPNQILKSAQFRVEVTPNGGAPAVSDQFRALPIATNDFVPVIGPAPSGGVAALSSFAYLIGSPASGSRGLAITAVGTNANISIQNFATVILLAVPIPTTAAVGNTYTIKVLEPSGTSDAQQTPVRLSPMEARSILVTNLSYIVGDTSPGGWYNAGEFGNGDLSNNDVNNAFYAALGLRLPFTFTDAFDAMDAFPEDTATSVGGDGEIRFLDWQRILRRSLRLDTKNWTRSWSSSGVRVAQAGTLTSVANSRARTFSSTGAGAVWVRQAVLGAVTVQNANPRDVVSVPVYLKVASGANVSGMLFNSVISPDGGSPKLEQPAKFLLAAGVPNGSPASFDINTVGYGWDVGAFNPPLQNSNLLGHVQFTVPAAAQAGDCYTLRFSKADGSPDLNTQYDFETIRACVWIGSAAPTAPDLISDEWKLSFFGSLTNSQAQANADPDGDAVPNWKEYQAGTNPADANSLLTLTAPAWDAAQKGIALRWLTAPGKSYVLERSSDLGANNWTVIANNVLGNGEVREFIDTNTTQNAQFYRVRVQP